MFAQKQTNKQKVREAINGGRHATNLRITIDLLLHPNKVVGWNPHETCPEFSRRRHRVTPKQPAQHSRSSLGSLHAGPSRPRRRRRPALRKHQTWKSRRFVHGIYTSGAFS